MARFEDTYKVEVVSLSTGRVGIILPYMHFKRIWEKKGTKRFIEFGVLREAIYEPGVEALFKDGILDIPNLGVKIELGLEPEGAKEPENIIILNDAQKKRALTVLPMHEFKELLGKLGREQRLALVEYAIANECSDFNRCDLLKQVTEIDVIRAIQLKREDTKE